MPSTSPDVENNVTHLVGRRRARGSVSTIADDASPNAHNGKDVYELEWDDPGQSEDPDETSIVGPHHAQGSSTPIDPNNRRWWELFTQATFEDDYEKADWVQTRNITAILLVRDVLLLLVTVALLLTTLILVHTLTLPQRYPVVHKWYHSTEYRRNFVGANGDAASPSMSSPSFLDLTLNHSYPSLVPYLSLIGVRQYPFAMVEFLLTIISQSGGTMDQRCLIGMGTAAHRFLPTQTTPPGSTGGIASDWAKVYQNIWAGWSDQHSVPMGPQNPFFWLFPSKMSFCNSILVNEWIDQQLWDSKSLKLAVIMQEGLVAYARQEAESGKSTKQMFAEMFGSLNINVQLSLSCAPLVNVANTQYTVALIGGVAGAVAMGAFILANAWNPIGWVTAAVAVAALIFGSVYGANQERRKQKEDAQAKCKTDFNNLLMLAAYDSCIIYSNNVEDAQLTCTQQKDVWQAWAERLVPPPTNR